MTAPAVPLRPLPDAILPGTPLTALAPMQDVTDHAFFHVMAHYGAPDYFFTEFFRVHGQSRPEKHILHSIDANETGRPIFAQLIGEHVPDMIRTARELLRHPVAGIDLNMGCPAPKIYKKNVGGGLLRDPAKIDELLGALRNEIAGRFTVKMRIGFDSTEHFAAVLDLINRHDVDLLSVHGRTVKEMYRSDVHYDFIGQAARTVRCPVLANGNVTSAARATDILRETGATGVMIGRHAIRNPWIFRQVRELSSGCTPFAPTLADARSYIEHLYRATTAPGVPEAAHVAKMKKYLNFVGQSVDAQGAFLHDMRRAMTERDLFAVCDRHLLTDPATPFADEPYAGVIARPNCETPIESCSLDTVTS
ncbi:MAG TPA: tRNA-dihydrouridine synthase family protein [Candidatus Didemnitutus sp.]|nr:tRNA-dihydrouridine synthase family protein [Candidatus Didemnitutus sp.]